MLGVVGQQCYMSVCMGLNTKLQRVRVSLRISLMLTIAPQLKIIPYFYDTSSHQTIDILTLASQLSHSPFVFDWSPESQSSHAVCRLVFSTREAPLEVEQNFDYLKRRESSFQCRE